MYMYMYMYTLSVWLLIIYLKQYVVFFLTLLLSAPSLLQIPFAYLFVG